LPGAGLLGAGGHGATPPLVASVVLLGVVVHGVTAVTPRACVVCWEVGGPRRAGGLISLGAGAGLAWGCAGGRGGGPGAPLRDAEGGEE